MVQPLGDRVLVEIIEEAEQKPAGDLYVPETAKEKSQRGKVIAVGSGKVLDNGTRIALDVKEGDTVYFAKYGGTDAMLDPIYPSGNPGPPRPSRILTPQGFSRHHGQERHVVPGGGGVQLPRQGSRPGHRREGC